MESSIRTDSIISRIIRRGFSRRTPVREASGSHHAPNPRMTRPGASRSRVAKLWATKAGLRVQMGMMPEPTRMRSVTEA